MLSHISLGVLDLARATRFYDGALNELGYVRLWSHDTGVGYGERGWKDEKLAIFAKGTAAKAPGEGWHLALTALSRAAVDRFHAAALANGGTDLGLPGLRPHYGPHYYAAFVRDPDGYKIEAVCHKV